MYMRIYMYICIYVYIYMIPPRLWDVSDGGVHPPEAKAKAGFFFHQLPVWLAPMVRGPPIHDPYRPLAAFGLIGSDGSATSHPRPIPSMNYS